MKTMGRKRKKNKKGVVASAKERLTTMVGGETPAPAVPPSDATDPISFRKFVRPNVANIEAQLNATLEGLERVAASGNRSALRKGIKGFAHALYGKELGTLPIGGAMLADLEKIVQTAVAMGRGKDIGVLLAAGLEESLDPKKYPKALTDTAKLLAQRAGSGMTGVVETAVSKPGFWSKLMAGLAKPGGYLKTAGLIAAPFVAEKVIDRAVRGKPNQDRIDELLNQDWSVSGDAGTDFSDLLAQMVEANPAFGDLLVTQPDQAMSAAASFLPQVASEPQNVPYGSVGPSVGRVNRS